MHETDSLRVELVDDGGVIVAADEELRRICRDVIERPLIGKPRSVTITIEVTPEVDKETGENFPSIGWKVGAKVPGRKGRVTLGFVEDGEIKVNLGDRKNPLQQTLFSQSEVKTENVTPLHAGKGGQ